MIDPSTIGPPPYPVELFLEVIDNIVKNGQAAKEDRKAGLPMNGSNVHLSSFLIGEATLVRLLVSDAVARFQIKNGRLPSRIVLSKENFLKYTLLLQQMDERFAWLKGKSVQYILDCEFAQDDIPIVMIENHPVIVE